MPNFGVAFISLYGLMPIFGVNYSKIGFIILGSNTPPFDICLFTSTVCQASNENKYIFILSNSTSEI